MIIDLIIGVIVIVFLIKGYRKGLIACLIDFFAVIIALVLAYCLCGTVAEAIKTNTEVDETIKEFIIDHTPGGADIKIEADENLPDVIQEKINSSVDGINETKSKALDGTATEITNNIMKALAFIGIFILVRLVLVVVKWISKIFTKIPVIEQINGIGGIVMGFLESAILIYTIFGVISLISPMLTETKIIEKINESYFGQRMYNNNLVVNYLYGNKSKDKADMDAKNETNETNETNKTNGMNDANVSKTNEANATNTTK